MSRRGVIFDLDGTLADTLATIGLAVNDGLEEVGLPVHPIDAYRTMVGEGVSVLCERALGSESHRRDELLEKVMAHYHRHPMRETTLYDGVQVLERLEAETRDAFCEKRLRWSMVPHLPKSSWIPWLDVEDIAGASARLEEIDDLSFEFDSDEGLY